MNFPSVEFPWLGNGTIIAVIAIVHVIISHGIAIGTSVLTVSLEYQANKRRNQALDDLAKKVAKWVLIITTTVGAMTGVGIWLSTMVIQPDSIGSLLRIFFWAWVTEWVVFITEVILLIIYYYTWDSWKSPEKKRKHIMLGVSLSIASWLTMAIITGVLAAKLTPGDWTSTRSFWDAFINPTYMPSLGFRMFLGVMLAVVIVSFFIRIFVKDVSLREQAYKVFGFWGAISLPFTLVLGLWYLWAIPDQAYDLIVLSSGMSENMFKILNGIALLILLVFLFWLVKSPKTVPIILSFALLGSAIGFIGEFEVVRESVRKPYIIYDYMYANGILAQDKEKIQEEGFLKNATWANVKEITPENQVEAGREIFVGECLTCHTIDGWRTKRALGKRLAGWDEETLKNYIPTMHNVRVMMPPFMGTEEELDALAAYLKTQIDEVNGETEVSQNE